MTERKRLIELIERAEEKFAKYTLHSVHDDNKEIPKREEMIADELLENGVIVPPCKVGDTVYQADTAGRIYEIKVKGIIYDTDGVAFDDRAIGKTVFLTKEEAEKALEAMK